MRHLARLALAAALCVCASARMLPLTWTLDTVGRVHAPLPISTPWASLLDGPRYVVISVRMIQASNFAAALQACANNDRANESVATGVTWQQGHGHVTLLCQRRRRLDQVAHNDVVLQRLIVLNGSTRPDDIDSNACPTGMLKLHAPRDGVVVCTRSARAQDALPVGNYIADLAVTRERNYNNEAPGWRTIPTSVHIVEAEAWWRRIWRWDLTPLRSIQGVYISYRRPVLPISAMRVISGLRADHAFGACTALAGAAWQQAGDGVLDQHGTVGKTVLCVERNSNASTKPSLMALAIVSTQRGCAASYDRSQALTPAFLLCSRWGDVNLTKPSFVADVNLVRVASSESGTDPTDLDFIPGNFDLVSAANLNANDSTYDAEVFLFDRKYRTDTFPSPPPLTKPPLRAHVYRDDVNQNAVALSFKILQLADIHYTGNPNQPCQQVPEGMVCSEALMSKWIDDLLDVEKPDFVVYTGDNVQTGSVKFHHVAMDMATRGVEAKKIPYAMVVGNHDEESGFTREEIIDIAVHKPHSYTQRGPAEVPGVGNYELAVHAPTEGPWGSNGTEVLRMYFLDSHSYPNKTQYPHVSATYDWVRPRQIEYYKQLSRSHKDSRVPSLMFFHIPLVEFAADPASQSNGLQLETVCSPDVNTNLFSTLVDIAEVKAVMVGHDHVNEYCTKREGIQLCYGGGTGLGLAYSRLGFDRRARVIEWNMTAQGKRTITSWKRHFGAISERKNEETLYSETSVDSQP